MIKPVLITVAAAFILSACGDSKPPAKAPTPPPAEKKVEPKPEPKK